MNDKYAHVDDNVYYITENIMGPVEHTIEYEKLFYNFNSQLESCSCSDVSDVCLDVLCKCLRNSGGDNYFKYSNDRLLKSSLRLKTKTYPIFECNSYCSCSTDCCNRVVQKGPIECLDIRRCDKGLGLFATTAIPSGTFVCEYAGELLTKSQAAARHYYNKTKGKSNYIFCLRELSTNGEPVVTIVDPSTFGNVGRYINHSCEPNCLIVPVRCDSPIPKLAIFSQKDIKANEEITFHYGINDEVNEEAVTERTPCLCKTDSCSGFMPFHSY